MAIRSHKRINVERLMQALPFARRGPNRNTDSCGDVCCAFRSSAVESVLQPLGARSGFGDGLSSRGQ